MARSFFSSFARSFINQIGRDSGKVVSNSIYGDRHATPIRHVGGGAAAASSISLEDVPIEKAVVRQNIEVGNWTIAFYLFLGISIIFIGPILLIFNGIKRLSRKEIRIKRLISDEIYQPDEMEGKEKVFVGNETYIKKEKSPSTQHEMEVDHRIGRIYLIAGILFLCFDIFMYLSLIPI
ncbi:MAG: hypothetical protein LUC37_00115, partial [Prevotella sp.]|nr:hypothetical protein [Prevotella sp.]